jgi:hypothetical protein
MLSAVITAQEMVALARITMAYHALHSFMMSGKGGNATPLLRECLLAENEAEEELGISFEKIAFAKDAAIIE